MNYETCTVDELIELGAAAAPSVFDAPERDHRDRDGGRRRGTVNLEGRLVGADPRPHALAAGPADLAATIFRLAQEAAAAALNTGIEVLAPVAGEELTAELRALTLPPPKPTAPEKSTDDDFTVETWAVPR